MCIHKYGKWEDQEIIKTYDPVTGTEIPIRQTLVQARVCRKCGKKKFRRVKI